jgi:hypothetical protein
MNLAEHLTDTAATGPLMTGYRGRPPENAAFLDAAGEFRADVTGPAEPDGATAYPGRSAS